MEHGSILVVDDEALIRMTTVDIVEDAGYCALEAGNADQAIIMLERWPEIAAVLTDVNMPGSMDGLQLSRLIRDRWPLIGLVVTSGRFLTKAMQMPAGVHFIAKPYTPDEIISAVQNCAA